MEFKKDNYRLTLVQDYEGVNIYLFEIYNINPLLFLNLKPLDEIDTENDDKTITRDIPRKIFSKGDFFQSSVSKFDKTDKYKHISLLSVTHEILLENKDELNFLKRIFSSSLLNYKEEVFITEEAKDFWFLQMNKKPEIPISYFKTDRRFLLKIND